MAPEGAQENVLWALSAVSLLAPTRLTRAWGAESVRAVNPPTLHVTLHNIGTGRRLSAATTHIVHAYTHTCCTNTVYSPKNLGTLLSHQVTVYLFIHLFYIGLSHKPFPSVIALMLWVPITPSSDKGSVTARPWPLNPCWQQSRLVLQGRLRCVFADAGDDT